MEPPQTEYHHFPPATSILFTILSNPILRAELYERGRKATDPVQMGIWIIYTRMVLLKKLLENDSHGKETDYIKEGFKTCSQLEFCIKTLENIIYNIPIQLREHEISGEMSDHFFEKISYNDRVEEDRVDTIMESVVNFDHKPYLTKFTSGIPTATLRQKSPTLQKFRTYTPSTWWSSSS